MAALPNAACRTALLLPGENLETVVLHLVPPAQPGGPIGELAGGLDEADRRGAPKTRRRYATTYSCIWVAAWLLATAAAGVGNACSLSFREAPRLGRRARGKRALRNYRAAA
jgi:hypothetical protein